MVGQSRHLPLDLYWHAATSGNPLNIRGWEEWEVNDDHKVIASLGWFDAEDDARQAEG